MMSQTFAHAVKATILNSLIIVIRIYHVFINLYLDFISFFVSGSNAVMSIPAHESLPEITIFWPFPECHRGWFSGLEEEA